MQEKPSVVSFKDWVWGLGDLVAKAAGQQGEYLRLYVCLAQQIGCSGSQQCQKYAYRSVGLQCNAMTTSGTTFGLKTGYINLGLKQAT